MGGYTNFNSSIVQHLHFRVNLFKDDLSVCSFKGNSTSSTELMHLYKKLFFSCAVIYLSQHWTLYLTTFLPTPISLHLLLHLVISSNIFHLLGQDFHPARVLAGFHRNTPSAHLLTSHASTALFTVVPPTSYISPP